MSAGNAKGRFDMALSFLEGSDKDLEQAIKWLDKAFDVADAEDVAEFSSQLTPMEGLDAQFKAHFVNKIGEASLSAAKAALEADDPDYELIESLLKDLAEGGNAEAQYCLAKVYHDADEPIEDDEKYAKWLQKAAENGWEEARKELERDAKLADEWVANVESGPFGVKAYCIAGMEYRAGKTLRGLPHEKDILKAIELYEKGFDAGDAQCARELSEIFDTGDGVQADSGKAHEWMLKAAEKGDAVAMVLAGRNFLHGEGIDKDAVKAVSWFRKAAGAGSVHGQSILGDCFKYGWGVAQDCQQAVKWYEKAIAPDKAKFPDDTECDVEPSYDAMYELSELLLNGEDVDKDEARGVELLKNAAEKGHAKAQFMYGSLLINPSAMNVSGVAQDVSAGIEMLRKSSDQSFGMAECTLATFYAQGIGIAKDLDKAKDLCERALEHGGLMKDMEDDARKMLAELESAIDSSKETIEEYPGMDENASEGDKAEFKELYLKAQNGDSDAQYSLGVRLSLGRYGASKNRSLASDWYKKSADGGNIKAMVSLADYYKDGEVDGKDVDDAIGLYKKAALAGDWRAQHVLAEIYSSGESVPVDYAEALKWALLAADNDGTADVLSLVGKCYEEGLGTEKNMTRAFQYYQKAAKKDSPDAQSALARIGDALGDNLYGDVKFGPGAPEKDKVECRKVYAEALEGRPGAEYEMGNILSEGMYCVLVNKKEAFGWYMKAAEHGFADAQYEVARFYLLGEKDVVDCNDEEKFKWYWEAASQGHVESMRKVADSFYYGSGVDEDDERAKIWYARAAKAGDDVSFKMLRDHWKLDDEELQKFYGAIEELPIGIKPNADDTKRAALLELERRAKVGDADAQFKLGDAFVYGTSGVVTNEHHGVMWLKKSAAQGNADAEKLLGDCYWGGWGVGENEGAAVKWYEKAARHGNVASQGKLGFCYLNGRGVERNTEIAKEWYQKAADKGDDDAKKALERLR